MASSREAGRPDRNRTVNHPMYKKPLHQSVLTENSAGSGSVTREMVYTRTRELARIAGRIPPQVSQVDYEQAKRELGFPEESPPEV